MSESMYAIFYIFIGAYSLALATWGVKILKDGIKIVIRNNTKELSEKVWELSYDVEAIIAHSDVMDDKIDSLMNDNDQLVKNIAGMQIDMEAMKEKIERLEAAPMLIRNT